MNKAEMNTKIEAFAKSTEKSLMILTSEIPDYSLSQFVKNCDVSIILKGHLKISPSSNVEVLVTNATDAKEVFLFCEQLTERSLPNLANNARIRNFTAFEEYFNRCTARKILKIDGKNGGVLLINDFAKNPYDGTPSKHIGFYGYSQEFGKEVSQNLKAALNNLLIDICGSQEITGLIDIANLPSYTYFKKLGLAPIGFRIDRR